MFTVEKTFRFESAHRLAKGYVGKCSNIHGHSWNGRLTFWIEDLDEYGMAMDFADVKKYIKKYIDPLDHAILVYEKDQELIDLCSKNGWLYYSFPFNPTSEELARYLCQLINAEVPEIVKKVKVQIDETCTSRTEFSS